MADLDTAIFETFWCCTVEPSYFVDMYEEITSNTFAGDLFTDSGAEASEPAK
jgi:hypothetical protein